MGGVGQEVRRLREDRGWVQAKLAVEAGMAPSTVNQIENGKRSPSASSLSKLAEALGVEAADFFPKAQAPLPLESVQRSGGEGVERDAPRYTAFEAFGRALAFGWAADLEEWEEKIPEDERADSFDFARLIQWGLEIAGTKAVYESIARELGDPPREELADTLRLLDEVDRASMAKTLRVFEPVKTFKEFQKIWEASDMDAVVSDAQRSG